MNLPDAQQKSRLRLTYEPCCTITKYNVVLSPSDLLKMN